LALGGVGRSALLSPFFRPARFRPLRSANPRLFFIRAPFRPVFSSFLGLSRVDFFFPSDEGCPARLFYFLSDEGSLVWFYFSK